MTLQGFEQVNYKWNDNFCRSEKHQLLWHSNSAILARSTFLKRRCVFKMEGHGDGSFACNP